MAIDSIETPFGVAQESVGGSAMYFSACASHFTQVRLVAVVGEDFPSAPLEFLKTREVDLKGLQTVEGKTFRWKGKYGADLSEAITLDTQLNVFGEFHPELPEDYRDSEYVFLANIDPDLQLEVLSQVKAPKFVALDTMNFWINNEVKLESLKRVLARVNMLVINEGEARLLAKTSNVVEAAVKIREMGPEYLVIKRGEYGALLFTPEHTFFAPAYPLEQVYDPTGAGDTFAGGLMGYLCRHGKFDEASLKTATIMGCVMASFCVEKFSYENMTGLDEDRIIDRFAKFKALTHFEPLGSLS